MSQPDVKPNNKKKLILMTLGLLFPIFLVGMAYLAVQSDAKNQAEYARQKAEILERVKAKEAEQKRLAAEQDEASQATMADATAE